MSKMQLSGARVLITGASSGLGAETARVLSGLGAEVALVARRRARLAELAGELRSSNRRVRVYPADLTDPAATQSTVDLAAADLGGLDIVINNAGLLLPGPVETAPVAEWDRMIAINVQGLLYVARAALPHLLTAARSNERRVADLVNVGSLSGKRAVAGSAVYGMTKWGVHGFSEALRQEVASRHVRVSVIAPGAAETELSDHMRDEFKSRPNPLFSNFEKLQPIDVAESIAFVVTRPNHVSVNEIVVRPTGQII